MRKSWILVVTLVVIAACTSGPDAGSPEPDATSGSTESTSATTTPSNPTTSRPTAPTSETPDTTGGPASLTGVVVRSATDPLHSMTVTGADMIVTGSVTPGSQVDLEVRSPDGQVTFSAPAQVQDDYFEGSVTLQTGVNVVSAISRGADGTRSEVEMGARHEPEATVELGFLTQVSSTEIVADYAQWLSGDEAAQAAFEDGVIASIDEGVPNDYYIRNVNPRLRTLPLADDVEIRLTSPAVDAFSIGVEVAEWLELFNDGVPWDHETDEVPDPPAPHFGFFGAGTVYAPYWLVLLNDEVIAIEQQYIP